MNIIRDMELRKYINAALDRSWSIGPVTYEDMELLTELDLGYSGVDTVEGLEYAINLKKLDLSGNNIEDISPLKQLKKLEYLNLEENKISDISAIRDLKK